VSPPQTSKILGFRSGRGSHNHRISVADRFFVKGNNHAAKENMSPESHEKRMKGLFKAWEFKRRKKNGEKFVSARQKLRKRVRLRITLTKEAREIQNIARTHADQAMRRLAEIINDPEVPESVAIVAAQVILDRAYGKASQTNINANVDANGKPSEITSGELNQRIEQTLKRVEELTGGVPKAPKSKERPVDLREPDIDTGGSTKH